MDRRIPDKGEAEKGNEVCRKYNAAYLPSDWRLSGANLTNVSMGLIPAVNPMAICKEDIMHSSSCSTASMVDSFCATIQDQRPTDSQNMGFCDVNVQNIASSSSRFEFRKDNLDPPRTDLENAIDIGWIPINSMLKGSMLLPTSSRMVPQSLSQFPTDSGFINGAARFSCFSGGNFSNLANPFSMPDSMSPYTRGPALMQGTRLNSLFGGQSQKNEMSTAEPSQDYMMPIKRGARRGSPLNIERNNSFLRSSDQAKQALCEPDNESDEAEFSNRGAQAEPSALGSGGTPAKTHGFKKRKRFGQNAELDQVKGTSNPPEATNGNSEIQLNGDQNPTPITSKHGGKHGKQGSLALDLNKKEYSHVRAKRGQATSRHSLAERARREKISAKMKFLQNLVPGCSKVTGNAVLLDEITNYIISLQRQVEFLSMKLATINPQLDLNNEGNFAIDIFQSQASPSFTLSFHPDMSIPYALMHLPQAGLIQGGLSGMGPSPDELRRSLTSHFTSMSGGYKEPDSQGLCKKPI